MAKRGPNREGQVKGCRKCGRTKKRLARFGNPISAFVRDKISAVEYFKLTNQPFRKG